MTRHKAHLPSVASRAGLLTLSLAIMLGGSGCAGHSARTLEARSALDRNQPAQALKLLNKELKVKEAGELPKKEKKITPLLVLDRSMVSLALSDYPATSKDLEYADKKVEMLDMSRTALDDIGKYVFSDSVGLYKAPPYEKIMINAMNMQAYLARHDLNGARVEARRMSIMAEYLSKNKNPAIALNAVGSYLAGFVFERSGRADVALRYYDEALEHVEFQSLIEPVFRLTKQDPYSTQRLRDFLARHAAATQTPAGQLGAGPSPAGQAAPASDPTPDPNQAPGDLLVIINYGRVPAKVARRIPIGLALTYASFFMTAASQTTANRMAAQGLVTWINFPDLEKSSRKLYAPQISLDNQGFALEGGGAVDVAARNVHEAEQGKVIAAAITRLITRIAIGTATGAAVKSATNDSFAGALAAVATQATLTAVDTPDTRSWSTLPARIAVGRARLAPGQHKLVIRAQGVSHEETFTLEPGGWHAVVLSALR